LNRDYGVQSWDRKFVYNMFFVYQPPFFKGQKGLVGHVLGGWTFAPIFSAGSGVPIQVNTVTQGQSYGEADASNFLNGTNFGPGENAVALGAYTQGSSRHNNVFGSDGIGTGGFGANMFSDPAAAYNLFRDPILGLDTGRVGGAGTLRGLPYWNVDFSLSKAVNITERVSAEFSTVFTNVFNHVQLGDPGNLTLVYAPGQTASNLTVPGTFGIISSTVNFNNNNDNKASPNTGTGLPRQLQFMVRFIF